MSKILLILHVLAAVIAVGPVTVAASMFPAAARKAFAEPGSGLSVLRALNRICRVYAIFGIAVPFFGLATAGSMRVFGDAWVIVSIVLTAAAAGVLALLVLPGQNAILAALDAEPPSAPVTAGRVAMYTGMFNLLWAVVTVLMIVRPGSTTGA
ncbi:membrane protein [Amycolatopsis sp. MJM2582]|uniref:Integral membrane protein n=1 Tax=Amycolatopsis keratiniphila subsp. keratiniphila TaxID=227715 RepID=A0A1W2LNB1_9PSEU|nr:MULTISPECIES: membrane protein [Amycolatopsis]KFZ77236.1 membrane protein [Amycolatopsis sp. MJM2582]OKJ93175.1 hypothetical protein AMK34_32675 [Amycolatopsis sp. CB00013]OLZ43344.1 hypothetical protein BS330_42880 [Amycolatopsis keratiniphila subsp. nogabecina]ONF64692.1 hypothetical protein AVR91_0228910 [Amycolatopsis keratiniphila subsp. keratiniphila]RSN30289.1 hypothetical protein DMC61_18915 [Amycolatopsis sp. WAC 04169]